MLIEEKYYRRHISLRFFKPKFPGLVMIIQCAGPTEHDNSNPGPEPVHCRQGLGRTPATLSRRVLQQAIITHRQINHIY